MTIFAVVLLTIAFFTVLGSFAPELEWRKERAAYADSKQRELENEREIIAMYTADTYGGKTPEETIALMLAALKKNDIVTASKYYELSVQPQAWKDLKAELEKNGNMEELRSYIAEVFEKGKKSCANIETDYGGCTFRYIYKTTEDKTVLIEGTSNKIFVPKGSESSKVINMGLNQYSRVWKLSD